MVEEKESGRTSRKGLKKHLPLSHGAPILVHEATVGKGDIGCGFLKESATVPRPGAVHCKGLRVGNYVPHGIQGSVIADVQTQD